MATSHLHGLTFGAYNLSALMQLKLHVNLIGFLFLHSKCMQLITNQMGETTCINVVTIHDICTLLVYCIDGVMYIMYTWGYVHNVHMGHFIL